MTWPFPYRNFDTQHATRKRNTIHVQYLHSPFRCSQKLACLFVRNVGYPLNPEPSQKKKLKLCCRRVDSISGRSLADSSVKQSILHCVRVWTFFFFSHCLVIFFLAASI
ncbi:hypothetical protein K450DRAFT_231868 [Umbelopsis ramanniana AG]|uniref:Uncharacterized protein n=1 Tax=Umbelopsis ramanniana AG TaxID=1314678 RepID=A0AAD5HEP3_UMBRA|nr:uncharacterized protein K450DRAFT_231868 [Umbelopsis ramanniana AG]KAI8581552.1 hypothetical protein K450DRAFT_231868 [Umbelopsis ramanniana AG]